MLAHLVRNRAAAMGLMVALSGLMLASGADAQPVQQPERAQTLSRPSTDGKVLGGIKTGTDAAGRGMDRAGDATLGGVNKAADSASRPIRNFGNWLGGKLESGPGAAARQRAAEKQAP